MSPRWCGELPDGALACCGIVTALLAWGCGPREDAPHVAVAGSAPSAVSAPATSGGPSAVSGPATSSTPKARSAPATSGAPSAVSAAPLVPADAPWLVALPDGDVVALPVGAREPRPVMLAVHGATGRPEWVCGAARAMFGPYPMVVCPRAAGKGASFTWSSGASIALASARALAAAEAQWGPAMRPEGRIWMTYSQSAILLAGAVAHPSLPSFSRALLWEGLPAPSAAATAAQGLRAHGMESVRLVAAQAGNRAPAAQMAGRLQRAGLEAELVYLGSVGHFFTAKHTTAGRQAAERLLAGVPGWEPVLAFAHAAP